MFIVEVIQNRDDRAAVFQQIFIGHPCRRIPLTWGDIMTRLKKNTKPFTCTISYWNGEMAVPVSEMTEDEHKTAATLMVLRMANMYYKPKGYKVFSPEISVKIDTI